MDAFFERLLALAWYIGVALNAASFALIGLLGYAWLPPALAIIRTQPMRSAEMLLWCAALFPFLVAMACLFAATLFDLGGTSEIGTAVVRVTIWPALLGAPAVLLFSMWLDDHGWDRAG
jgi:hypothetical protein